MKACVWHKRNDVRVEEVPDPPPPGEGEVQIRVEWCGICGTDVEEYVHGPLYIPVDRPNPLTGAVAPMVLGHEIVGTVSQVGRGVTSLRAGDRVAPDPIIFCGHCRHCERHDVHLCESMAHLGLTTHGGLAEYVNTLAKVCFKLPAHVPTEVGALSEPASVCVHAVRRSRMRIGDTVAIVGAGTIGLLTLQVVRLAGASRIFIVEPLEARRKLALRFGAERALDPDEVDPRDAVFELTGGRGVDRVIECGGNQTTLALAPRLARKKGLVVITGLHNEPVGINLFPVVCDETEIVGSFSHVFDEDFKQAVEWIGEGKLQPESLITARIPLDEAVTGGLDSLLKRNREHLKILINPRS